MVDSSKQVNIQLIRPVKFRVFSFALLRSDFIVFRPLWSVLVFLISFFVLHQNKPFSPFFAKFHTKQNPPEAFNFKWAVFAPFRALVEPYNEGGSSSTTVSMYSFLRASTSLCSPSGACGVTTTSCWSL